jgi:hypothetical protein
MERNHAARRRQALWIERLAWNAAAGASLLVMIWLLLCSLTWLDRIAPVDTSAPLGEASHPVAGLEVRGDRHAHEAAPRDRPGS